MVAEKAKMSSPLAAASPLIEVEQHGLVLEVEVDAADSEVLCCCCCC